MPSKYESAGRTLRCAGLQPGDYYLFKTIRAYFAYDMRQVLTLGLRWLYAGMHDPAMAKMIEQLAIEVKQADLDVNDNAHYDDIGTLPKQGVRR